MSESTAITVVALAAVALFALGVCACDQECDCPDCASGTGADGGVTCESAPGACADLGDDAAQQFGCCFEGSVFWCDADVLESIDCQAGGFLCGYSESGDFMDCI